MAERSNDKHVLDLLEELGYSKALAEKRVQIYNNAGKGMGQYESVKFGVDYDVVIAGSRGDGTGIYVDSDVDKILVQNRVRCFENESEIKENINNSTLFQLDSNNVPEGYAKLRFISKAENHFDEIHTNITEALEETNGASYLRNDHKLSAGIGRSYEGDNWGWTEKNLIHAETKSGPSQPYKIQVPFLSKYILLDDVLAFRCDCRSVTDDWCNRERNHDWPSKTLIDTVKSLDAFVVPVGVKGSENEHLQWRVCLTLTELVLVQSFNDIQIKVYGALKMIVKHYFTPICENITSYIVKTVLFWQIEQTSSTEWNEEHFEERLVNALKYLNTCISNEQLPNYMIPTRNMLHNKISSTEKQSLIEIVDFLIGEKPYIYIKYIVLNNLTEAESSEPTQKTKDQYTQNIYVREQTYPRTQEQKPSSEKRSLSPKEASQLLQQQSATLQEEYIPTSAIEAIVQRKVREEFVLSIFALPPETIPAILKQIFESKEQSEIIGIISVDVLPYIRENNPYGYFTNIRSMEDAEIYTKCAGTLLSDRQACILL